MARSDKNGFAEHDRAIVLGPNSHSKHAAATRLHAHRFRKGQPVTLVEFDKSDSSWLAESSAGTTCWVYSDCLGSEGPSDQEVEEALASIKQAFDTNL